MKLWSCHFTINYSVTISGQQRLHNSFYKLWILVVGKYSRWYLLRLKSKQYIMEHSLNFKENWLLFALSSYTCFFFYKIIYVREVSGCRERAWTILGSFLLPSMNSDMVSLLSLSESICNKSTNQKWVLFVLTNQKRVLWWVNQWEKSIYLLKYLLNPGHGIFILTILITLKILKNENCWNVF